MHDMFYSKHDTHFLSIQGNKNTRGFIAQNNGVLCLPLWQEKEERKHFKTVLKGRCQGIEFNCIDSVSYSYVPNCLIMR